MSARLQPTGQQHDITDVHDRTPAQVPGEHLLTVTLEFAVNPTPEDGTWFLDRENLIRNVGPLCRWCGAETVGDVRRPCPGRHSG